MSPVSSSYTFSRSGQEGTFLSKKSTHTFFRKMHYPNQDLKGKIMNCTIEKSISMNYQNKNLKDKIINCTISISISDF